MADDASPPAPDPAPAPVPPPPSPPPAPTVVSRKRSLPSVVWLVPVIALAVGISLVVNSLLQAGPHITIEFRTAEGLEAGKTEVRYKEVVVGRVDAVSLSEDRKRVIASVRLARSAASLAVEDTNFWVVRPRIGVGGISGLATLVSGAYIGADAGVSSEDRKAFVGLEVPPFVLRGEPGRSFVLRAPDLGSLDVGSPIFYRRTRVGRVVGYTLDAEKDELLVQIFIEAPYERLVNNRSRFWNASGFDFTLNASGLTVDTQALTSVIGGGVAFEHSDQATPDTKDEAEAAAGTRFWLFTNRKAAIAPPDGPPMRLRFVFDQSVRGLSVGSPIDFLGVEIGEVRAIRPGYDAEHKRYPMEVTADVHPLRLGAVRGALVEDGAGQRPAPARTPDQRRAERRELNLQLFQRLVENGLRAQLRTGNLLTGQMYVALDFIPKTRPARLAMADGVPEVPTVPGTLSDVQPQIAEIVAKINKVPFDDIGRDLRATLAQAREAIAKLSPEAQQSLAEVRKTLDALQGSLGKFDRNLLDPDAPVQRNVEQTMTDLQRAAQSLRVLTDYLQRHPESLLRGKPADPPLPSLENAR
ncbi:MlaD family protein [Rhizobacter sp. SG703]|uniref:PqiB family protein n=1 Tax=Rhizobacter sp. SG703 TaxID=2587140 RepID=UPI0014476921|nr:MlaD family protein [Rhizobacter sp. SG703]NKI96984.1 paraquat-inducible protein B [Rhizobacter sp. SG703]